jgi:hypothetical protein
MPRVKSFANYDPGNPTSPAGLLYPTDLNAIEDNYHFAFSHYRPLLPAMDTVARAGGWGATGDLRLVADLETTQLASTGRPRSAARATAPARAPSCPRPRGAPYRRPGRPYSRSVSRTQRRRLLGLLREVVDR